MARVDMFLYYQVQVGNHLTTLPLMGQVLALRPPCPGDLRIARASRWDVRVLVIALSLACYHIWSIRVTRRVVEVHPVI
jgi:hypothetical protein